MSKRKRRRVRFRSLRIGTRFWEVKDEWGHAFRFPLTKIRPKVVHGDKMTAKAGRVLFSFHDDDIVEIE